MEYVKNIYTYTYIRITIFLYYWNNVMYTYVLELRLAPAAYCKSIPCFYNNIVFQYDFAIYLYTFMPHI